MTKIVIDPFNRNVEQRIAGRPGGERRDCVVRAFTIATGRPYAEVHALFAKHGRKAGHGTFPRTSRAVAKELGLRYVLLQKRRQVAGFLDDMEFSKPIAAFIRGHAFAVEKGAVVDIEPVKPKQLVSAYYTL